jgi:phosphoglycerol transferase
VSSSGARQALAKVIAAYGGVAALSLAVAWPVLGLGHAHLRYPFQYGGDALVSGAEIKAIIENGLTLRVPQLGAPGVLEAHDFPPQFDYLHLVAIKVMSLFSGNWALIINLYYLLGFPVIALSALAVLRHFKVSTLPAAVVSVLFAYLPSRLTKAEGHLFLDTFFQVPLAILVVLWVCSDEPPLVRAAVPGRWFSLELRRARTLIACAICAAIGALGIYYAFFSAWLLVTGGLCSSLRRRSARNALAGVAMAGVIGLTLGVEALPTRLYQAHHGPNAAAAHRTPGESELFGLKLAQLLLPIDGHRVTRFRALRERYNDTAPLVNENSLTALGIVGSVAFLALLGVLLIASRSGGNGMLGTLAALNLLALLLGTMGGFGSLFALLVSPLIRTYCRINVFISFMCLFATALALDRVWRSRRDLGAPIMAIVLVFGLYDQASLLAIFEYEGGQRASISDADMVRGIERLVPPGTMIFQLPFQSFPEGAQVARAESYDCLRPYLYSHSLRWSFGAIRGRNDQWTQEVAGLPLADLLKQIEAVGFGGVLVDRAGYDDTGAAIEGALRTRLGPSPLVSGNGRLAFYPLPLPLPSSVPSPLAPPLPASRPSTPL